MGEHPLLAKLAADALAEERTPEPAPLSPEAERRAVELLGDAIEQTHKRRSRFVAALAIGGVACAAAAAVVALRVGHPSTPGANAIAAAAHGFAVSGDVQVIHDGAPHPLEDSGALFVHDRVVSGEGRGTVAMPRGSHVGIDPQSEIAIEEASLVERFALKRGALRADVTKLHPGERFVVTTDDAEIEVRGTSFRVAVGEKKATCGIETSTWVGVLEGTVWVRARGNETVLSAGQSWPSCSEQATQVPRPEAAKAAEPAALQPKSAVASANNVEKNTEKKPSKPTGPVAEGDKANKIAAAQTTNTTASDTPTSSAASNSATSNVVPDPSVLAEQNHVFEDALAAKRRGDGAQAIAGFDALLARWPGSPLAESAAAERMRVLGASHDPRARGAAEQYLARYPRGFARSDAQAILQP